MTSGWDKIAVNLYNGTVITLTSGLLIKYLQMRRSPVRTACIQGKKKHARLLSREVLGFFKQKNCRTEHLMWHEHCYHGNVFSNIILIFIVIIFSHTAMLASRQIKKLSILLKTHFPSFMFVFLVCSAHRSASWLVALEVTLILEKAKKKCTMIFFLINKSIHNTQKLSNSIVMN